MKVITAFSEGHLADPESQYHSATYMANSILAVFEKRGWEVVRYNRDAWESATLDQRKYLSDADLFWGYPDEFDEWDRVLPEHTIRICHACGLPAYEYSQRRFMEMHRSGKADFDDLPRPLETYPDRYLLPDWWVVHDRYSIKDFWHQEGAKKDRTRYIPVPVDTDWFHPVDYRSSHPFRVLFLSRALTTGKGFHDVLAAWRAFDDPEAELICMGMYDPADWAKEVEATPRLTVKGWIPSNRPEYLEAINWCDVALYLSPVEGGGAGAISEVAACGLPMIASHASGWRSLFEDGTHGLLVDPHNADLVAEALTFARDHPEWRHWAGGYARGRVQDECHPALVAIKISDFLDEVTSAN